MVRTLTINKSPNGRSPGKKAVSIHIGGVYAAKRPTVIYTLLGSCVAVCLYNPVLRMGAMNHILLPGEADIQNYSAATRFGINAMEVLINKMIQFGSDRQSLQAKIFGGAHVLPSISPENGIGLKISNFVENFLMQEKIPIISKDIGGRSGRKIYFHTDTGDVFVKRLESKLLNSIQKDEEKTIPHVLRQMKKPGGVTLFE
jgi:chemotaxis protein CheD